MTSALNSHHYEKLTPKKNPEVARIMLEQGVGRKRAYTIIREQKMASFKDEVVPQTQRVLVLGCLVNTGVKTAHGLLDQLHDDGVSIDMHDVVKTLWSLQKTRFVSFREKTNPPSLYAIQVTDQGLAAYADMSERAATFLRDANHAISVGAQVEGKVVVADPVAYVSQNGAVVEQIYPGTPEWDESEKALEQQRKEEVYNISVVDFDTLPLTKSIRDRARKEAVLAQAAKLLEEAGEDDIALTVMQRTEYSPLELEVKTLLTAIGEI